MRGGTSLRRVLRGEFFIRILICVISLHCGFRGGVLAQCSAVVANGGHVALRSASVLRLSRRRSCAAVTCWRYRVAASGGQGGIGGLRVPPTPSLDSRVPLCTAAAPLRGWRRRSGAFLRGALPQGQGTWEAFGWCIVLLRLRCRYPQNKTGGPDSPPDLLCRVLARAHF